MVNQDRRRWMQWFALATGGAGSAMLSACANLTDRETVRVNLVGMDLLPGEGMEVRMAVKLRIQNPRDTALDFDGIAIDLDVRDANFASGVSSERGSIPRFGETVVTVPVSVSALAMLRQAMGVASGASLTHIDYVLRGRLAGAGFGGLRFSSSGEIDLPKGLGMK